MKIRRPPSYGGPVTAFYVLPPDDIDGVYWVQATFSDGLACWRCNACGDKREDGFSLIVARFRFWRHKRRCEARCTPEQMVADLEEIRRETKQ